MSLLEIPESVPEANRIKTQDQAINFLEQLLTALLDQRENCRMVLPGKPEMTARMQQRAFWIFLTKQGEVMGALNALFAAGLVSPVAYASFNQRAIASLAPDTVDLTGK